MRIALISVTTKGQSHAEMISSKLLSRPTIISVDLFHGNIRKTLRRIINDYDCIIGIMATGIMVRSICRLLRGKEFDPAVLVIDQNLEHVISLVSGHLGGANQMTLLLAELINADPVITTATDLENILGVDSIARKYYLHLKNTSPIRMINKALVNGDKVKLYVPLSFEFLKNDPGIENAYEVIFWDENFLKAEVQEVQLDLFPKKIVAGIGSRRDVSVQKVIKALENAIGCLDLPLERLDLLATAEIKKDEPGIIEAAWTLNLPLKIINIQEIQDLDNKDVSISKWVMDTFKIPGVAEPSSLIAAGKNSSLLIRKISLNGVSVSLASSSN